MGSCFWPAFPLIHSRAFTSSWYSLSTTVNQFALWQVMYNGRTHCGWLMTSTGHGWTLSVCWSRPPIHSAQPFENQQLSLCTLNIHTTTKVSHSQPFTGLECPAEIIICIIVGMRFCGAKCVFLTVTKSYDCMNKCVLNHNSALYDWWYRRCQLQRIVANVALWHGLYWLGV